MASKLDICNIALSNIGCLPIQSLTDNSESSRLLLLNWDRCLESVLREFPWNFATTVQKLNLSTENPIDYDYAYAYPFNCLQILGIYEKDCHKKFDYTVRASTDGTMKIILTDLEEAYIKYTQKIQDTTLYDPSFVEAFAYKLSWEINNAKTGNAQQTQEMAQRYQQALYKAYHNTATEQRKKDMYPDRYIQCRR